MTVSFVIFGILMPVVGVILLVQAMIAYHHEPCFSGLVGFDGVYLSVKYKREAA